MTTVVERAFRVSATSAAWTLSASTAAILLGFVEASLALVAFGAVQLFDFVADVLLVVHFRIGAAAEHLERGVLKVVSLGLIATGCVTVVFSVVHLRNGEGPSNSYASLVLATASVVALTALAARKRHLATRLSSDGLRADGNLTAVGAALAAVTVVGISTAEVFDWWFADPLTALCISSGAVAIGKRTWPRGGE
jgi:divalent metal cation (Fe/Co/Zn/Cd) transporter